MRKLIARVNMIEVLLFLFLWPSRFLLTSDCNRRSFLAHVHITSARSPFSKYSNKSTDIKVIPKIISSNKMSKINKNHCVFP